jgi:Zn-dependent protease
MSQMPPPYNPPPDAGGDPQGYQPFQQYYQPQPQPPPPGGQTRRRGGVVGGLLAILVAIWAYGKYALLFLTKFGAAKTIITLFVSLGFYALITPLPFAIGLVLMILVHEMGHVVEIRRQGMQASAPLFIPFLGAAIFQRQHPTDALKQAQIGIAGPIAGTVGAVASYVLAGAVGVHTQLGQTLLLWASIGFLINLFNLIPLGMLDGGWILAVVSKWFQVVGLVLLAAAVIFLHVFSFIIIVIVVLGIPAAIQRFRDDKLPYYTSVPVSARLGMGVAWFALVGFLAYAMLQAQSMLPRGLG